MHIVIPMSGFGKRFIDAGYDVPKPLVLVDEKPMIEFVVSMFPADSTFTFVCNEEHLRSTPLNTVLSTIVKNAEIVSIAPHKKGPVYAVFQCLDRIKDDEEVIVSYCDFYSDWDFEDFLKDTRGRGAEGAVAAYRGFHPHMLGTDNYAFIRDEDRWLKAIQEKKPFTSNRMAEYASNGAYYFRRGAHLKKYFKQLMDEDIQVNGEYYVSMVYNLLVADELPVSVYEVPHMLQWGTPQDLQEYQGWSDYFSHLATQPSPTAASRTNRQPEEKKLRQITAIVPMAGRGARFQAEGYETAKPLIPVDGKPMVVQATRSLPPADRYVFVALEEHLANLPIREGLMAEFQPISVVALLAVTEGQACTCAAALQSAIPPISMEERVVIGACDNGMVFNLERFNKLISDDNVAAVAFTFKNHPSSKRNPQMYGWIDVDENERIKRVSVKMPITDTPEKDHAIVGSFYFRRARYIMEGLERLKEKDRRVNGEFYLDSLLGELAEMGMDCRVFPVEYYVCWGTPNDLRVYNYWREFFSTCRWHPYHRYQNKQQTPVDSVELGAG